MTEIACIKYNNNVPKEDVGKAVKIINPEEIEERKRNSIKRRFYWAKGLPDIYHINGNDKLKRWGFCIHGCVDGFSSKIFWLHVASSNNDPLITANYFFTCIKRYKLVPQTLRMKRGTENIYYEDLQVYFIKNMESFFYAMLTRNQRNEYLWSQHKTF